MFSKIIGSGSFLPENKVTNQDLTQLVDTSSDWIESRSGIKQRFFADKNITSSDLAYFASIEAIKNANLNITDIDLIIVATTTPDMVFPGTATILQNKLSKKLICPAFDVQAACSGFIYALSTGSQFIEAGTHKKVIVVGADKMSSIIDYTDRKNCVLFGDGGGAVLLEPSKDETGIQDYLLRSDGSGGDMLCLKAGGSLRPASLETIKNKEHYIYQEGSSVFKFAVTNMADISEEIMNKNNLNSDDVAYLVPHQANKRIIDATAKRMGVGPEKVLLNIEKYGNTTAGTIPLCLWDYEKKFKKGDNLILAAFGGGFTWGSLYLKWSYNS